MSAVRTLGDICTSIRSGFACGEEDEDGIAQFRMNNVTRGGAIDWTKVRRVPSSMVRDGFDLAAGDILFNATNSPDLVGKTAYFDGYREPVTFSNHFMRLRVDQSLADARYVARFLMWQWQRGLFRSMCRQWVNQASISKEHLAAIEIPFLPLEEQRRIAAILDQAGILRRKRREAITAIDRLRRATFVEQFGTVQAPKGRRISLGEVVEFKGGGTPPRSCPEYYNGRICWASSKDMTAEFISDTQEHISEAAISNSATNLMPKGTVLVVVKSKILMRRLPVAIAEVPLCFNQDIKGMSVKAPYVPSFVLMSLLVDQGWLLQKARGANTEGLTLDHLRSFPVAAASKKNIDAFDRAMSKLFSLSHRMEQSAKKLEALFLSLQEQAFADEERPCHLERSAARVAAE